MPLRSSLRGATVAALLTGSLLAAMPGAAGAAVPLAGNYSGPTVQPPPPNSRTPARSTSGVQVRVVQRHGPQDPQNRRHHPAPLRVGTR